VFEAADCLGILLADGWTVRAATLSPGHLGLSAFVGVRGGAWIAKF
jgi:hypothetical protein